MLDLDYKNESNDYIVDMFFGIEEEKLYIGIKYKDGSISKYPFTIYNYNAITARLERQYFEYIDGFQVYIIRRFATETFNLILKIVCFLVVNDLCYDSNKIFNYWFAIFTGLIFILSILKSGIKFSSLVYKNNDNLKVMNKYLKNKDKFLIDFPNGESFYYLNISNINSNTNIDAWIEYMQSEAMKTEIKALKLLYEGEQK